MNGSSILRFVLDGRLMEIDFTTEKRWKPTTTVLNYLRSLPGHKGVKEGCGEGDCGACTVVIGSLAPDGRIEYRAVTSCLVFLPMLHGKQLITVENLAQGVGGNLQLHPVQQAMVEHYGSQCGYCTPGIVMSLFALFKTHSSPSAITVREYLSGNLCRCTGYKQIEEAAEACLQPGGEDQFSEEEERVAAMLGDICRNGPAFMADLPGVKYFQPGELDEALEIRSNHPGILMIGGASDVALKQSKKHEKLPPILDLSRIERLGHMHADSESITLGAGLTLEQVRIACRENLPDLCKLLDVFGSMQIRNVATLGGNLGSASPIGDTLPLLMAYKAEIRLEEKGGERWLQVEDFIKGYRETALRAGEIITDVRISFPSPAEKIFTCKVSKRRDLDISTVSGGFRLRLDSRDKVEEIILAFGGMAASPQRAIMTEQYLKGRSWTREVVEEAMDILFNEFNPISDARSGANARRIACRNLLMKFWLESSGQGRLTKKSDDGQGIS